MPQKMIIPVGNIGCGKSTIARKYAKLGYNIINMDTIQSMLSGGEYGMYDNNKKPVYSAIETTAIETSIENGDSVFIDRTNIDEKRRKSFIDIANKHDVETIALNWGRGNLESLSRRLENPKGTTCKTWESVHSFMEESYQEPNLNEGFTKIIEAPKQFKFYAFDFDGTIVKNKYPEIGEILNGTVDKMNEIYENHKNIIIVWSCRNGDDEYQMKEFLLKNNIPFDFINENPIFKTGSKKIFAHEYYDDRNK